MVQYINIINMELFQLVRRMCFLNRSIVLLFIVCSIHHTLYAQNSYLKQYDYIIKDLLNTVKSDTLYFSFDGDSCIENSIRKHVKSKRAKIEMPMKDDYVYCLTYPKKMKQGLSIQVIERWLVAGKKTLYNNTFIEYFFRKKKVIRKASDTIHGNKL